MSNTPSRRAALLASLLAAIAILVGALAAGCGSRTGRATQPIVVAVDARTSQQILGELTAQFLRDRGYTVDVRTGLQEEWMTRRALEAGSVDMLWQETGRVWHVYLNHDQPIGSEAELYRRVKDQDRLKNIVWLTPCSWSARMSLVVARETAAAHRLASIADLAHYTSRTDPNLVLCVPEALYDTPWGIRGLERVHQFRFQESLVRFADQGEAYERLLDKSCDVALGYGRDLSPYAGALVTLRDGNAFFPASSLALTVRAPVLGEYPELERILTELTASLDPHSLASMEQQLEARGARLDRVARQFLRDAGLISR